MSASYRWILAAVWLAVAAVFYLHGTETTGPLPPAFALVLASYNGIRAMTARRVQPKKLFLHRRPRTRAESQTDPDPNFRFDDDAPGA